MQNLLREYQDDLANAGWRIHQISHAPDGKPVVVVPENWAGYVAIFSIIGFPIGCGMAIYRKEHDQDPFPGVYVALASWAVSLIALAIKNKIKKKDWILVQAKCVDREIRRVGVSKGVSWASRILCEFEQAGSLIKCTPTVHWSTFRSESSALRFLDSRIDTDGRCTLRVNPKNLREANLSERRYGTGSRVN